MKFFIIINDLSISDSNKQLLFVAIHEATFQRKYDHEKHRQMKDSLVRKDFSAVFHSFPKLVRTMRAKIQAFAQNFQ